MEDNLENFPEVMHQTPERTESKTPERTTSDKNSPETTSETNSIKFPEKTSETSKNSQEKTSETSKNSQEKTNSTKNSSENIPETTSETTKNSQEKTTSETTRNSPQISTKNTPEKTTSNNFLQNLSETTKKTHPDEDVDPFKLFNIPKQNIHVTPEIVPPAAEAAIRHLKPPEPIVLTELIEPDVEKMNQIEEERRKFEEERRKFEEERRRSFIGRKSPRAQFVNSSTPSPDTTQHPSFGGKGVYGRKSPGNKRPIFTISVSSSSASSSSSESEDEIETKSPQITPKTTINICSSTSDEEELSNSLKEINIKSKEQMYKEQQEKRMAKMEATMQLILEKLDKKERKGIYEEDKELVEKSRAKKEIVQQVKEGGDQEKLEEIAQKTIPKSKERKIMEELPESQATKILQVLSQIIYLRRLEINLEGIENTKKLQNTYPNSHVDEMKTFRSFYEEQVKRVEEKMNDFQVQWRPQIESWYNKSKEFKEAHPTFINDLFLIGCKRQEEQKTKVGNFLKKFFPSVFPGDKFNKVVNGWVFQAETLKKNGNMNENKNAWKKEEWEAVSKNKVLRKFDRWTNRQEKERIKDLKAQEEAHRKYLENQRREKEREDERKFQYLQNVRSPKKNNDKFRFFS